MTLNQDFYRRNEVLAVSRELLGKYLVTEWDGRRTAGQIVETEAYRSPDDKACHAHARRRTSRTEVMYAAGGVAYVYLCYGIHHLFNVVTGPAEEAQAVLIRAVEPVEGVEHMLKRRDLPKISPRLTAGPGMLTQAMGIEKTQSGVSLLPGDSPMWIEDRGLIIPEEEIQTGPRVGVAYAEECAHWPWRFRHRSSQWTSRAEPDYGSA